MNSGSIWVHFKIKGSYYVPATVIGAGNTVEAMVAAVPEHIRG